MESVSGQSECEWLSRIQMVASEKNWPGAEPGTGLRLLQESEIRGVKGSVIAV